MKHWKEIRNSTLSYRKILSILGTENIFLFVEPETQTISKEDTEILLNKELQIIKEILANVGFRRLSNRLYEFNGYLITKHQIVRAILVQFLGGKCVKCQFTNLVALQLDHIHGDGGKERQYFKSSSTMYSYYLNHLSEVKQQLQVLCANCNWIKKEQQNEVSRKGNRGNNFEKQLLGEELFNKINGSRFEGGIIK